MTSTARELLRPDEKAPSMGFLAPSTATEVRQLEALGVDSLWVGGHVASPNPSPEVMVWLARLVEQTTDVVVGTATLLLPLYPPAVVAKQLADLDRASKGRIAVGIGVGGEYASDFEAAEVPIGERGSRTDEAVTLLREFWSGEPVTHAGRHHRYDNLRIHPAPHQPGGPPVIVTGRQPVAMRRAARVGDGWMPYLYSPERYARSVDTIRTEAEQRRRPLDDFGWYAFVFVSLDDDARQARRTAVDFLGGTYRSDFDEMIDRVACVGDTDQVTARLQAFVDAGVDHFVVALCGGGQETAGRLVGDILPSLRRGDDGAGSGSGDRAGKST